MAEAEKTTPEADIAEVEEMPMSVTLEPAGQSLRERAGRFGRRLFRWVLVLAILAGIGYGAWLGWPVLRDRVINPIQGNIADMGVVQDRLDTNDARLAGIEADIEALAAAQLELAAAQALVLESVQAVQDEIASTGDRIAALDELQVELSAGVAAGVVETERQVRLLKTMELMGRARLFLYQSNFGLAEQDIEGARNILAQTALDYPETDQEILTETIERLDRAMQALPEFPVQASDDLDIAWQVLLGQIPAIALAPGPAPSEATTTTIAP